MGIGRWSEDCVGLWHGSGSNFWSVVSCGDALCLGWMLMNWWILGGWPWGGWKRRIMSEWFEEPCFTYQRDAGGRELSVNCLHREQMFHNSLLSWADYDVTHLWLNKSRLGIQHNSAARLNDHWNSFTKACGMWAVTGTFKSPDDKFYPWNVLWLKQELVWKSSLSSADHEVSQPTYPSQVWPVGQMMSEVLSLLWVPRQVGQMLCSWLQCLIAIPLQAMAAAGFLLLPCSAAFASASPVLCGGVHLLPSHFRPPLN